MEAPRLSDLIRTGYQEPLSRELDEAALASCERDRLRPQLELARHDPTLLDALLLKVIGHYRRGSRSVWASFLLELIAPSLGRRLPRYRTLMPHFSEDDIHQQLVVEVLEAALQLDLPDGCRWVDRRLLGRATARLNRQLNRELRRQRSQQQWPNEEDDEEVEAGDIAPLRRVFKATVLDGLEARGLMRIDISEAKARALIDEFGDLAVEALKQLTEIRVVK